MIYLRNTALKFQVEYSTHTHIHIRQNQTYHVVLTATKREIFEGTFGKLGVT